MLVCQVKFRIFLIMNCIYLIINLLYLIGWIKKTVSKMIETAFLRFEAV